MTGAEAARRGALEAALTRALVRRDLEREAGWSLADARAELEEARLHLVAARANTLHAAHVLGVTLVPAKENPPC